MEVSVKNLNINDKFSYEDKIYTCLSFSSCGNDRIRGLSVMQSDGSKIYLCFPREMKLNTIK